VRRKPRRRASQWTALRVLALCVGAMLPFIALHLPRAGERNAAAAALSYSAPPAPAPRSLRCVAAPGYVAAARANAGSLATMEWAPYRRAEHGWEIYAPLIAHELHTGCAPDSSGFAAALLRWQRMNAAAGGGVFRPADFDAMRRIWGARHGNMFVGGVCPGPPLPSALADARPEEGYRGKHVQMLSRVLMAYREMIAAARREAPSIAVDRESLAIFSAYRTPEYDAARCAREGNCDGVLRAVCSPHRTGLALDLNVGAAAGYAVDSAADPNRLFQTRTAAYRWLVNNADRFGFVNYPFEPWHWEWRHKV
jgi:D-alanyl-D-alanine carboxypeptidase